MYHATASADNTGLPKHGQFLPLPHGLTNGGRLVYRRANVASVPVCNAIAELQGIGSEVAK